MGEMTREEAIEVIEQDIPCEHDRDLIEALEMAISALSKNKGEWIPVSERLPEEREWYLAVFKEKDTDFQLIPRVADYIGHGENKWQWIDGEGVPQEYFDLLECVAWQPLPEPYKGESEDKRGDKAE